MVSDRERQRIPMGKIKIYVVRDNATVVNYPDCGGTLYSVTLTLGKCLFTVNICISYIELWIAFLFKFMHALYFRILSRTVSFLVVFNVKKKSKHEKW